MVDVDKEGHARRMALPWHVCHSNGSLVDSFSDEKEAIEDCKERNERAKALDLECRYTVKPKKEN